jgi:hypothetical protein
MNLKPRTQISTSPRNAITVLSWTVIDLGTIIMSFTNPATGTLQSATVFLAGVEAPSTPSSDAPSQKEIDRAHRVFATLQHALSPGVRDVKLDIIALRAASEFAVGVVYTRRGNEPWSCLNQKLRSLGYRTRGKRI